MSAAVARLLRRADFLRVAGARRKWITPGLILQAARREKGSDRSPAVPRVGLTASRKVGSAVARNRARRRLRAVAEDVIPAHAAPGYDYVLIARKETVTRPYPALRRDLETALRRLKAYRDDGTKG